MTTRAKKNRRVVQEAPGVGAGERWETGRGDGTGIYLAGDPKRRAKIGDFGEGGRAPGGNASAVERARIAAQAPLMYEALLDIISGAREDGALTDGRDGNTPSEGHGPGCGCGLCEGVVALALAEGGGRCVICGCTQDDACVDMRSGSGCAWVDRDRLLCTAHPQRAIDAAQRFLAKAGR
jgi:hypothetical protein